MDCPRDALGRNECLEFFAQAAQVAQAAADEDGTDVSYFAVAGKQEPPGCIARESYLCEHSNTFWIGERINLSRLRVDVDAEEALHAEDGQQDRDGRRRGL